MKYAQLIAKNTIFLSVGKVAGDLCTLVFLVYFARNFGVEFMGKYGFAMSMGGLLTIGVTLGMDTILVRDVSKDKSKLGLYFGNFLIAQIVTAFLSWLMIAMIALLSNWNADTKWVVVIIGTYHAFFKLSGLFGSVFRAHEEMQYPALLETGHKILILLVGAAGIFVWKNPLLALAAYPVSGLARFAMGFVVSAYKYGMPRMTPDFKFLRGALARSMPFFFIIVLSQFYDRLGIILLTLMQGESLSGIYSAADRLMVTAGVGLAMFGTALFPAMSRISHESDLEFRKLYDRSMRLIVTLTLPSAVMLFVLSGPVMVVLFGDRFAGSVPVMKILCWGLVLAGVRMMMGSLIIVKQHEKAWLKMQLIVYLSYAVACLILIPPYGAVGLAYAKLGTQILVVAAAYHFIRRNIHDENPLKAASGTLWSCATALGCHFLMAGWSPWLTAPAVLAVLVFTMFLFKAVQIHDLTFLKTMLLSGERSGGEEIEPAYVEKSGP